MKANFVKTIVRHPIEILSGVALLGAIACAQTPRFTISSIQRYDEGKVTYSSRLEVRVDTNSLYTGVRPECDKLLRQFDDSSYIRLITDQINGVLKNYHVEGVHDDIKVRYLQMRGPPRIRYVRTTSEDPETLEKLANDLIANTCVDQVEK